MSTKAELESRIWEEINRPAKDIDIPKLKKMLNCADEQPLSEMERSRLNQVWKNIQQRISNS